MGLISEVLAHGGFLPQLAELNKKQETKWTRRNGIFFSLFWFIFWLPLMTSILGGVFGIETLGELSALVGIFGSILIFIYAMAFMKRPGSYFDPRQYSNPNQVPHYLNGPAQGHALPPQQSIPASAYAPPRAGSWRDTKDLEPTSVTESTTKLLEKEDKI
jgi:hypothetical protein